MRTNNKQIAGSNSQQIQAETIINYGISEERVRTIFNELLPVALCDYFDEALTEAKRRNAVFEEKIIKRLDEEKAFSILKDPAFQFLLREAQKRAAMAGREEDYDLLTELLVHRFKNATNKNKALGVSRAIEVVDRISDEALQGLTIVHSAEVITPITGDLRRGLSIYDDLFSKLIYMNLPNGDDWLEQLDILDAVRLGQSGLGGLRPLVDFWYDRLDGSLKYGIDIQSDDYRKAKELLAEAGLESGFLIESKKGFVKLDASNRGCIKNLRNAAGEPLRESDISVLEMIYDLYGDDKMPKEEFETIIKEHENLKRLCEWWSGLKQQSVYITIVGKVLAHANAQRLDKNIPSLD